MELQLLLTVLEDARLRGHGGADFPTATKLRAVAAGRRRPVVVVNGTEGEPLSRKDRFLLTSSPDAILDGATIVAGALKAQRIIVAVDEQSLGALTAVQRAAGAWVKTARIEVVAVPSGYVVGQETALVSALAGHAPKPTLKRPFEDGVGGRPTFVSNAETFVQIARIARGRYDGSRLVTVSGAVPRTTVLRATPGMTVAGALTAAGGVTEAVSGVLLGGYAGTWAAVPDGFGLNLNTAILYALGTSTCPVAEVARVTRWMAGQSAGQCGPCVFGLAAIADSLEDLCHGGDRAAPARLRRWCATVTGRGACGHPDGVARYVASALDVFDAHFRDHAAHGACDRCHATLNRRVRQAVPA